jgi:AsmA protein
MKKVLFILAGVAAAVVIAVVIFVLTFDLNRYKSRIETAASEATGLTVRLNGRVGLTLFPLANVSLEDIQVQNQSSEVVSAKKAVVKIRLLPLVRGKILIRQVKLISPGFFITRDRKGHFNFAAPEIKHAGKGLAGKPFELETILIKNGHVLYLNEKTGGEIEASECDLAIKNLFVDGGGSIYDGSFDGDLSCREVKAKGLEVSDISVAMTARKGKFEANLLTMKIFGGDGSGSIKGVMAGESHEHTVDFAITKFRFEEVLGAFKQKKSIRGELNLESHLTMKGRNPNEMTRTAQGEISLRGQDLVHVSIDLDDVLEKYEDTQHTTLVDMGAFFIAGPLGTLLTKGYAFGSVYTASMGGKSEIQKLVSDWKVNNGVVKAQDVAFSTVQNRVAMKGKLDFVNEQFEDVTVAVVDEKGCVRFWQKIHGNFRDPRIGKVSTLRSIAGPLINLYETTRDVFRGGECDIFYAGSVRHPK